MIFFFGGGRGTQQKCFTQSFHQWGWSEMLFWVPYLSRGITQRMRNSGSNICTAQPYRAEEALTSPMGWHHSLLLLLLRRPPPPKTFRPFRLRRAGVPPYVLQIVPPTTSLLLKLRNNASCNLDCYTTWGRNRSPFRRIGNQVVCRSISLVCPECVFRKCPPHSLDTNLRHDGNRRPTFVVQKQVPSPAAEKWVPIKIH